MAKALTVKSVEAMQSGASRREVPDGLLSGLYFVVQPSGTKSWAVRYRFEGRPKKYTIPGAYPAIGLGDARELARAALRAVAEGRDPSTEKKAARHAREAERDNFENVASEFVERYAKANTRETSWRETERLLARDVTPHWRGRSVQSITRRDVIELLDRKVDAGAAIMANRVLAAVRRLFNWAVERGILETSPCTGVKPPAAERSRDRVLSDDELRLVWRASEKLGPPFQQFVQLLMLTAQRREEVAGMRWAEVDPDARLWTLPRERVKNNQEHQVPLSAQAVEVLATAPRIKGKKGYVLTTNGETPVSGYSRAKDRLDAAMLAIQRERDAEVEPLARWTYHDLRRSAASGMARLGIQLPVIEKVLNHTSGSFAGIVAVYQRHSFADEKRHALDAWAAHIERIVAGKPGDNVVPMERTESSRRG